MEDMEFTTLLAGGSYYGPEAFHGLVAGSYLRAQPDPCGRLTGNQHNDPNALALYNERKQLCGYIPKNWATLLAPVLDTGQVALYVRVLFPGGPSNTHLRCIVRPVAQEAPLS